MLKEGLGAHIRRNDQPEQWLAIRFGASSINTRMWLARFGKP